MSKSNLHWRSYVQPGRIFGNLYFVGTYAASSHIIDTGEGGTGDRHFDLFWGLWSLNYNLKNSSFGNIFLEAYGKSKVNPDLIRAFGCICALERE